MKYSRSLRRSSIDSIMTGAFKSSSLSTGCAAAFSKAASSMVRFPEANERAGRIANAAAPPARKVRRFRFMPEYRRKTALGSIQRFDDLVHVDVLDDHVADDGDFLGFAGLNFYDEVVDFRSDLVTIVFGEQNRKGHPLNDFHDAGTRTEIAG